MDVCVLIVPFHGAACDEQMLMERLKPKRPSRFSAAFLVCAESFSYPFAKMEKLNGTLNKMIMRRNQLDEGKKRWRDEMVTKRGALSTALLPNALSVWRNERG